MRPANSRAQASPAAWLAALAVLTLLSGGASTASAQPPAQEKPAPKAQPAAPARPAPGKADKPDTPAADPSKPKPRFTIEDTRPEPEDKPAPKPRFTADDMQPDPQEKPATRTKPRFSASDLEDETPKAPLNPNQFSLGGWRACVRCHEKQTTAYLEGPHAADWNERTPAGRLGCETCHGPGEAHVQTPGAKGLVRTPARLSARDASELCLMCHARGRHAWWQGSMHDARGVTCVSCHSVHRPASERAHLKRVSVVAACADCHRDKAARMERSAHMPVREGKMDCASCHNEHGSANVKLLRAGHTVNESCTSCHAEKRGPFLWDHPPARENCTTCHDAHGSSNDRILVSNLTLLCQRCHIVTRHPATPYDAVSVANRVNRIVGRGCVTCHPMIHGSNHPSGQFFMR